MALSVKYLARMALQKVASDPQVREKAKDAARVFVEEASQGGHENGRAYAAGRALRRTINRMKADPSSETD